MIFAPKLKNREAIDEQNGEKSRRLIVPIPKTEPPLEESFVFPAENGGGKRRAAKRDKETTGTIPKNKRSTITIF